jgi:Tfp pilus assembly protein PilE
MGAYTLYELLITLGLASLVLTIGLPSFSNIVADHRLRMEVNALFHNVHLARKESIARRRAVTLCPSADGQSCGPSEAWSDGWIRFVNIDRDEPPVRDVGQCVTSASHCCIIIVCRQAVSLSRIAPLLRSGRHGFAPPTGRWSCATGKTARSRVPW